MTHQIFPGLKQPTSQLFFDLQAFIAENGRRLRLAEKLESERLKCNLPDMRQYNEPPRLKQINRWTKSEVEILINAENCELLLNRSKKAIMAKRVKLGLI